MRKAMKRCGRAKPSEELVGVEARCLRIRHRIE
ncbi:hypothetical protein A2U01_0054621, partial [Trifolium medium]|nr:hypothetical protein [Trifolium medium]